MINQLCWMRPQRGVKISWQGIERKKSKFQNETPEAFDFDFFFVCVNKIQGAF